MGDGGYGTLRATSKYNHVLNICLCNTQRFQCLGGNNKRKQYKCLIIIFVMTMMMLVMMVISMNPNKGPSSKVYI